MTWTLIAKPTREVASDGFYADTTSSLSVWADDGTEIWDEAFVDSGSPSDGASTEPVQDGAYAEMSHDWLAVTLESARPPDASWVDNGSNAFVDDRGFAWGGSEFEWWTTVVKPSDSWVAITVAD